MKSGMWEIDAVWHSRSRNLHALTAPCMQSKFPNTLSKLLSQALRIVKTWTIENGVNANKTKLVMFRRKHKIADITKT
uniref:Uncharacterized protein n=1 Tax=Megaselia scalaris TaxID=36166 RepID=T1H351_MEGSC